MRTTLEAKRRRRMGWVLLPTGLAALSLILGTCFLAGMTKDAAAEGASTKAPKLTPRLEARVELGRRLFYEPLVSRSKLRSCASCHAPAHGFSDPDRVSLDDVGTTPRHSQTIIDAAFNPSAHWDGEFASVEELVTRRLGSANVYYGTERPIRPRGPVTPRPIARMDGSEGGRPARRPFRDKFPLANTLRSPLTTELQTAGRYREAFKAAFGKEEVTLEKVALAISAYCYTIESTEAPIDRYLAGDKKAISVSARRGLALFKGRAGCADCHDMEGDHPLFTDFSFHNTGLVFHSLEALAAERLVASADGARIRVPRQPKEGEPRIEDRGLARLTRETRHERCFKTPTLRDVTRRGPYMHDGRFETLEDVVKWYAAGCGNDPKKSRFLGRFACSERDVKDLVAFLETLEGHERPGLAKAAWKKRARQTKLYFETKDGTTIRDLMVRLVPVGDPQPIKGLREETAVERMTDGLGCVTYRPGVRTHMRIVIPGDIPVEGGGLVPDTVRRLTLKVPIAGRMSFVVTFPKEWPAPKALVADHLSAVRTPGQQHARSIFRRGKVAELEDVRIARYEGWVRSDLPTSVTLRMPGIARSRRGTKVARLAVTLKAGATQTIDLTAN